MLFVAVVVLAGAGIAAAVWFFLLRDDDGDGSDSELETYFAAAAPLINEIDDRDFEVTVPGETFLRYATFLVETGNDLSAVEPPEEAAAAHEELVGGLQDATAALADLYDQHEDAATIDEVTGILQEDVALAAAFSRSAAACTDLKALADEHGIDVTLDLCAGPAPTATDVS
ncbi:MAG: hypothetical protein WEE64_01570 [Dehalococcoidia bacterium]